MSSPYRPLAGGVPDEQPLRFLEEPEYDEAFGPPDKVHRESLYRPFRELWQSSYPF